MKKKTELLQENVNDLQKKLDRCENANRILNKEREANLKDLKNLQNAVETLKAERDQLKSNEALLEKKINAAEETLHAVSKKLQIAKEVKFLLPQSLEQRRDQKLFSFQTNEHLKEAKLNENISKQQQIEDSDYAQVSQHLK